MAQGPIPTSAPATAPQPADRATPRLVGLVGNPNSGKSSLFNLLTGLRQRTGNFPGVTVEKKAGPLLLPGLAEPVELVDFPGAYSCYPTSLDERLVIQELTNPEGDLFPDAIVYVADATKLDKHLLLFTQLRDLDLPMLLVLNMADLLEREELTIDVEQLARRLDVPVVTVSSRENRGIGELRAALVALLQRPDDFRTRQSFFEPPAAGRDVLTELRRTLPARNDYHALLLTHHAPWLKHIPEQTRHRVQEARVKHGFHSLRAQVDETMDRYHTFESILRDTVRHRPAAETASDRIDRFLTHPVFGPLVFISLMLLIFQALFAWASVPMDMIEWFFGALGEGIRSSLPAGWVTDLLVDGVVAGLGGVLVFLPQIAILFFFIAILEEVGYLARAAYMFDSLMQRFGLNGRSVVALISGHACAIPAIMSTRTIANWKERLLTILVTPLTSCSARIPVYVILISFAVPEVVYGGWLNLQGLAFAGLYFLGILSAMLSALVFKWILKSKDRSFLMLELPQYRTPVWRNVFITVYRKSRAFVVGAGKVILVISIILWAASTYGPGEQMERAAAEAATTATEQNLGEEEAADLVASRKLEASYAGHLGKFITPAIEPLGYDWKIGIALLTSFAAREVFVGTMATIYSVGSADEDDFRIRERMAEEVDPVTGEPVYTVATAWSLLIFYVFAMMCMSTLAATKHETGGWKWPVVQFVFMTGLGYVGALVVYQWLS